VIITSVHLVLVGLFLDLIGVLLLGVDVLHVQRTLKKSATEVLDKVHSVFDEADEAGRSLRDVAFDHRHYDWDEGQVVYFQDSFDEKAARRSQVALNQSISNLTKGLSQLADIVLTGADAQEASANLSRKRTLVGLGLIIVGFALQIIGQLT
jgi:uncharacterized membrane protein YidH (DUF202 family)